MNVIIENILFDLIFFLGLLFIFDVNFNILVFINENI